jgi:hypothetical protein
MDGSSGVLKRWRVDFKAFSKGVSWMGEGYEPQEEWFL